MTGLPASIFGLADRGRIAPGYVADFVLFDPATVTDRASYADPNAVAHGVEVVWLAGRVAYTGDGGPTDRLGRLLRRPAR